MLATYIGEELGGGSSVSGFHVHHTPAGYLERLPQSPGFPIPVGGQSLIEGFGWSLSSPTREFFQFRLTFGF